MKKGSLWLLLILALGCVGWYMMRAGEPMQMVTTPDAIPAEAVRIVLRDDMFQPSSISIKKGVWVAFVNQNGDFFWPASDLHPTHDIYPEFDPLEPVASGMVWMFRFNKVGVWEFHDHLRSSRRGAITVTE